MEQGEIRPPLPSIRNWSRRLGAGRGTLELALKLLKREGLVRIQPRKGIELLPATKVYRDSSASPTVRWIAYGRDIPDTSGLEEIFEAISDGLKVHGIGFSIERCNSARLKAIHRRGERPDEMLLLVSLRKQFQALFVDFHRSALLLGLPFPSIRLPFISIDALAAVRNAVHRLSQRGISRITLVVKEGSGPELNEQFLQICSAVSRSIQGKTAHLPLDLHEQSAAAEKLAARMTGRHGLIVIYPIPAGVLMTALMRRGIRIPEEVEMVAVNTTLQAVRTVPVPAHYPFPVKAFARAICRAAAHYFKHGAIGPLRLLIPIRAAPEPPAR
jgi:DNA-binding LacI/PurR family transcriptional regulator